MAWTNSGMDINKLPQILKKNVNNSFDSRYLLIVQLELFSLSSPQAVPEGALSFRHQWRMYIGCLEVETESAKPNSTIKFILVDFNYTATT